MKVRARNLENYKVEITAGNHTFIADEPPDLGDGAGPDPYDLFLSALAACKVMTVQMYARRKEWPLEGVKISLSTSRSHARDCEECESDPNALIDIIEGEIDFDGPLSEEQLDRLEEISNRCPVHRSMTSETIIRTKRRR